MSACRSRGAKENSDSNVGEWICFLRSSAEKRAPKSEFKAKLAAKGDMRVAIHARNIGGCPKTVKTRIFASGRPPVPKNPIDGLPPPGSIFFPYSSHGGFSHEVFGICGGIARRHAARLADGCIGQRRPFGVRHREP